MLLFAKCACFSSLQFCYKITVRLIFVAPDYQKYQETEHSCSLEQNQKYLFNIETFFICKCERGQIDRVPWVNHFITYHDSFLIIHFIVYEDFSAFTSAICDPGILCLVFKGFTFEPVL